jgi:hypothetical protein
MKCDCCHRSFADAAIIKGLCAECRRKKAWREEHPKKVN